MKNKFTFGRNYGPFTKQSARHYYGAYMDAFVIGSMDKNLALQLIKFYKTYL